MSAAVPVSVYQAVRIQARVDALLNETPAQRWERYCSDERMTALQRKCEESRRRLLADRAAKAALAKVASPKAPAPPIGPATSGKGWKVVESPKRSSHEQLEAFAHNLFDLGWHGIPWPSGWRVRWGECAPSLGPVLGCTVFSAKVIVVDERHEHTAEELIRILVHEMTHMLHPTEKKDHGPLFTETLQRVMDYLNAKPEAASGAAPPPAWPPVAPPAAPASMPVESRLIRDAAGRAAAVVEIHGDGSVVEKVILRDEVGRVAGVKRKLTTAAAQLSSSDDNYTPPRPRLEPARVRRPPWGGSWRDDGWEYR